MLPEPAHVHVDLCAQVTYPDFRGFYPQYLSTASETPRCTSGAFLMVFPTLLDFPRPDIHLEGCLFFYTVGGLESIMIVSGSSMLTMSLSAYFAGCG